MFILQTVDGPNRPGITTPLPVTETTPPASEPCEGPNGHQKWAELVTKRALCRTRLPSVNTPEANNQFRKEHSLAGSDDIITQADFESFSAFFKGVPDSLQNGIKGLTVSKAITQLKNFFTSSPLFRYTEEHAGKFATGVVNQMNVDDTPKKGEQVIDVADLKEFERIANDPNYNPLVARIDRHIEEYNAAIRPGDKRHDLDPTGNSRGIVDNADFAKFNEYSDIIYGPDVPNIDRGPVRTRDARRALRDHFMSQGKSRRQATRIARKIVNQMNADGNKVIDMNDQRIFDKARPGDLVTTGGTAVDPLIGNAPIGNPDIVSAKAILSELLTTVTNDPNTPTSTILNSLNSAKALADGVIATNPGPITSREASLVQSQVNTLIAWINTYGSANLAVLDQVINHGPQTPESLLLGLATGVAVGTPGEVIDNGIVVGGGGDPSSHETTPTGDSTIVTEPNPFTG